MKRSLVSAERMHDPVRKLTPLCDGLTEHLVVSDVPGSTAICGRCTWHAKHQLVSGSLLIIYTRGLSDPDGIQQAFVALSMQHCFHDLCMFRMSLSLLFKTYLASGTLPTHLASRHARTAATAQRQPVNPRRQLQQQRLLCAITRATN